MIRRWFYIVAVTLLAAVAAAATYTPVALWALVVIGPPLLIGLHDSLQRQHTILRNFPLIGHVRYLFEMVRPEIQQYFIESNTDAFPIEREFRNIVYQRAKGELETQPFGTQRNVYRIGYEWAAHSLAPIPPLEEPPRIQIGGPGCRQPYSCSLLNISAMSFGALSKNAVLALNAGAKAGGFAHNTGESAISSYHLEPGGDLIWQIGTGYFGCRTRGWAVRRRAIQRPGGARRGADDRAQAVSGRETGARGGAAWAEGLGGDRGNSRGHAVANRHLAPRAFDVLDTRGSA